MKAYIFFALFFGFCILFGLLMQEAIEATFGPINEDRLIAAAALIMAIWGLHKSEQADAKIWSLENRIKEITRKLDVKRRPEHSLQSLT